MSRLAFLFFTLLAFCSFTFSHEGDEVVAVTKAAQQGVQQFLALIPTGMEDRYGFSTTDVKANCTIGKPLQVVTPDSLFYIKTHVLHPTSNPYFIRLTNEWRAPVVLAGNSKTLLTVAKNKETYSVVDLGGAELAKELQEKSTLAGAGDQLYLLRIYRLSADFFGYSPGSAASARYIPLSSALIAMPGLNSKPSYSLDEVLTIIKAATDEQAKN